LPFVALAIHEQVLTLAGKLSKPRWTRIAALYRIERVHTAVNTIKRKKTEKKNAPAADRGR
jgi:hypothetical protein